MSIEIARYQFHAWARKGISNNIIETDDLGGGTSTTLDRAEVPISVKLNNNAITKNFSLIGPGDIIGINPNMVVRTEPLNWITDFEPNYLSFIEFYDEEFAWRYTPASPQGKRLRPWIFLLVLKEDEFERTIRRIPLPSINLKKNSALPPHNETWLWAHVHSNADIPDDELSDYEEFLLSLNKTVNGDPDQLFCRLMNPRKLEPKTAYYAFLIPTFESGRKAGLDQPTTGINAQEPSWDSNGAKGEIPIYYEWYFRTSTNVDFESLVKLIESRPMDERVGIRDMDCSEPGFIKVDGSGPIPATSPPIIGLEGALKSPSTVSTKFPDPETDKDFQTELQAIANLPETIPADMNKDPIISVPVYGKNHAKKSKDDVILLDINNHSWLHDLNKDPRTRVAAGFGTMVVQKNQDTYMKKAWEQVTKIIEANRRIIVTKLMMWVAAQFNIKSFTKFQGNILLAVCKPIMKKVKGSSVTIFHLLQNSSLPAAMFSGSFRRIIRPNGPLARKINKNYKIDYKLIVDKINEDNTIISPPPKTPKDLFTTETISNIIFPQKLPSWLKWLLSQSRIVLVILFLIIIVLALVTGNFINFGIITAAIAALYLVVNRFRNNFLDSEVILDNKKMLDSIATIPPRPSFTLQLSDEEPRPAPTNPVPGQDSVEGKNFRSALVDLNTCLSLKAPETEILKFDLTNAHNKITNAINPYYSFPTRLVAQVKFPSYIPIIKPEKIFPAMAYPDFEDPMYKKLSDISSELLLPNLKLIPPNTISLLKTNQKFIESYLVGLNHEMGAELLWREYPTDARGSYFRQFWDVKGIIKPDDSKSEAENTEEYKDIDPIHTWSIYNELGRHNKRDAQGDAEQLVLVLRCDLLKRYPNTVIFAQKAVPGENIEDDPVIDLELNDNEFKKNVMFPLYKGEISPEIKFFGFDLTINQARGTEKTEGFNDDLGWFFIIQEIPGEPRFGMDITFNVGDDGASWDDLAWTKLQEDAKFIKASVSPSFTPNDQYLWAEDSAVMAYILFQKPSMVAVHAQEMLKDL
ncbi:MAG: hypothetical protein GY855_06820 [candidate division Zixibacteria bacterium]|nr:hypothetical protein [candidate division Zixibacteria bacterium]